MVSRSASTAHQMASGRQLHSTTTEKEEASSAHMAHWDAEMATEQAQWMLCLRQDVCDDPTLVLHEEFRQKFRVTYRVFDRIVDALKGSGLVQDPRVPKPGPPPIPAESKVLHILRMLAVGAQYDAFEEGSLCDGKTIQALCIKPASSRTKGFFDWFVDHFYDDWVRPPNREENRKRVEVHREDWDARHDRADGCSSPGLGCMSCGCTRIPLRKRGLPDKGV